MNKIVIGNYSKLKPTLFALPVCFLILIVIYLYTQDSLCAYKYVQIQKSCFLFLNSKLSQYPNAVYNLTQLGDTLVFLSLLSIFIVYAPKLWESLISASLVSAILTCVLKKAFTVPRPAAVFDNHSFIIVGKTLCGNNSLPSGHSITIFTILTVLMFAFMPIRLKHQICWTIFLVITGLILAFTRVGVGAHYPLDVITGGFVGYISGLTGIFISQQYKIWHWISNKKYYPVLILLLLVCFTIMINKIINENLIIFYFSLIGLVASLLKIMSVYVKR